MTNRTQTKTAYPTESRLDVELSHDGTARAWIYNTSANGEHFVTIAEGDRCTVVAIACQLSRVSGIPLHFDQLAGELFAKQAGESWTSSHDRLHADGDCICFDN